MSTELIPYEKQIGALSIADVRSQVNLIQQVMHSVMKRDEHYGVIPGTGTKPSLLKAGAEKLCLTFRLDPQYETTEKYDGAHLTVVSKCTLFHIPTGQRFGSGMGSCSTKESKYAYRQQSRKCPSCGKEAIIKGKADYGGGWLCFKKKDGCGAKFKEGDQAIEGQAVGRIANEDVADQYNTVLKMANKRSLVAAVLNATAASDIFTQDIEDTARDMGNVVHDVDETQAIATKITNAQIDALDALIKEHGIKYDDLIAKAEVNTLADIAAEDYEGACKWVKLQGAKKRNTKPADVAHEV